MIQFISKQFEYFRVLSLDVALGGVVFSNSLAHVFEIKLPFSVSLGLFLAIWLIYSFDHLVDAKQLKERASMQRHQFHYENQKSILLVMVVLVFIGIGNMIFMPVTTLIFGLTVSAMVSFYFFLSWRFKVFLIKEVFIASIYATGVFLGPVSLGGIDPMTLGYLLIQLFCLALLNLLIISNYEMDKDVRDGQSSWAVRFGGHQTSWHIKIIFGFQLVLQFVSLYVLQEIFWFQMLMLLMTIVLMMVFFLQNVFGKSDRYRVLGDFVFFIPGLTFWF